jgi:hypothetical protein
MKAEEWLSETIMCDGLDTILRRRAIWRFVTKGLEPFLTSLGYNLHLGSKDMSNGIATLLYYNRGQGLTGPYEFEKQHGYSDEYIQHYHHVVDQKAWDGLWEAWGFWDDVSLTSPYGWYRRLDVQEYVWSQINLRTSPQSRVVESYLQDPEDVEEDYAAPHF